MKRFFKNPVRTVQRKVFPLSPDAESLEASAKLIKIAESIERGFLSSRLEAISQESIDHKFYALIVQASLGTADALLLVDYHDLPARSDVSPEQIADIREKLDSNWETLKTFSDSMNVLIEILDKHCVTATFGDSYLVCRLHLYLTSACLDALKAGSADLVKKVLRDILIQVRNVGNKSGRGSPLEQMDEYLKAIGLFGGSEFATN